MLFRSAPEVADINTLAYVEDGTLATNGLSNLANNLAALLAVNGISSNITTVAGIDTDVTTVAGISANVTTVAGDTANIATIATNLNGSDTIGTVAGSISNVNTVGGSISNVNTVATNIASVNDFADKYRIGATDPTTDLDEGDLFYNTTSDTLKVYTGSAWEAGVTAGSGFLPLTGGTMTGALDVQSTITSDGLTVDTSADGNISTFKGDLNYFFIKGSGADTILSTVGSGGNASNLFFQTDPFASEVNRMQINKDGDISFYEDTGTTAKFFWMRVLRVWALGRAQSMVRWTLPTVTKLMVLH